MTQRGVFFFKLISFHHPFSPSLFTLKQYKKGDNLVYCYVCKKNIGFPGFPNHVRMEKKKFGDDIYIKLRLRRERKKVDPQGYFVLKYHKFTYQFTIDEFFQ